MPSSSNASKTSSKPAATAPPPSSSSTENRAADSLLSDAFVEHANRTAEAAVNRVAPIQALFEQMGMGASSRTTELEKDLKELVEEAMNNIGKRREGGGPIGEGDYLYGVSAILSHILLVQGRVDGLTKVRVLFCGYANKLDEIQKRIDDGEGSGAEANNLKRDSVMAQLKAEYEQVFGEAVHHLVSLIRPQPPRSL